MGEVKEVHAQWFADDPDPRSAEAAKWVEDAAYRDEGRETLAEFVSINEGEAKFRLTDRSAEWAELVEAALRDAEKRGADTKSRKATTAFCKCAMSEYDEAVKSNGMATGDGRELLPDDDWRIRATRRHENEIGAVFVAAMLYREATRAVKNEAEKERLADEAECEYYRQQYEAERAAILKEASMEFGEKLDVMRDEANKMQTAVNLAAKNSAEAKRAAERAAQTTAELPAAIAETKAEASGAKVAAERARAAAEKAAKKPTTVINAQPGATVTVVKPPRTDAGETHGKTARGWRTQADMAADFSKSAKKIGGKWYGKITEATVKDWENRYPNETKRERKSGYHAGLRNDPNPTPEIKQAYYEAAANWNGYWEKHNAAFLAWLKENPKGDHATFLKTWVRPGKTVHRNDTDKTMRYGADTSLPDALDSGDFDNET